jgi:hypothetical protein
MAHLLDYENATTPMGKALAAIACARAKSAVQREWSWAERAVGHAVEVGLVVGPAILGTGRRPNCAVLEGLLLARQFPSLAGWTSVIARRPERKLVVDVRWVYTPPGRYTLASWDDLGGKITWQDYYDGDVLNEPAEWRQRADGLETLLWIRERAPKVQGLPGQDITFLLERFDAALSLLADIQSNIDLADEVISMRIMEMLRLQKEDVHT